MAKPWDGRVRPIGRRAAWLYARPLVRGWSGGLFSLLASAVVFPLVFINGTHINHGTMPYFIGGLIATGIVFLGSALTARLLTPDLVFKLEKLVLGEWRATPTSPPFAVIQPTLEAENGETAAVVMHEWRAHLEMTGTTYHLRQLVGQPALEGGLQLPFLDRIGPLPPGPTAAHLQFAVDGVRREQVRNAMTAGNPLFLTVEVRSGKHWWKTKKDISELPMQQQPALPS